MSDLRIRNIREEDRQKLISLGVRAFNGVSIDQNIEGTFGRLGNTSWQERKGSQIDTDLSSNPNGNFVAELDGEVVGFVTTRLLPEYETGWISHLAVSENCRGQGIGRALIKHALEYFRSRGLRFARIETLEQNSICTHLYPKLGFQEVARQVYYFMRL